MIGQDYSNLEYIIVDGGSTDGSVETIRNHSQHLAYWSSKPDSGQYAAISDGFSRSSGEILAWINADDMYLPSTLAIVAEIFESLPEVEWITTNFPLIWDASGRAVACSGYDGFCRNAFMRGAYLPGAGWPAIGWIQQEATFWRRSLWERSGGSVGGDFPLAGDFELWARFFQHADLYGVDAPLAGFRAHGDQRSVLHYDQYINEARRALVLHGGRFPNRLGQIGSRVLASTLPHRIAAKVGLIEMGKVIAWEASDSRWGVGFRQIRPSPFACRLP